MACVSLLPDRLQAHVKPWCNQVLFWFAAEWQEFRSYVYAAESNPDSSKYKKTRDRPDLYTDKWDGSEYKGSAFNVLNIILVVSVLVPLLGIGFALWSYGTVWG